MARHLEWRELKTGVAALTALTVIGLGTLLFARVGALRGDTSTVYVLTDDAEGVLGGTEVWLAGHQVGQVKSVLLRPATTDTSRRVQIETQILRNRLHLVRQNSRASIGPGGNLIGSPVVFFTAGSSDAPPLKHGDTVATTSASKMKPLGLRVTDLLARLSALADSGKRLSLLLNSPSGTIGAFKQSGMPQLADANSTLAALQAKATTGSGTVGLAMRGDLTARLARISAAKDSLSVLMSSERGNIGRFKKDSTLSKTVAGIKADIDSLTAAFAAGKGIGRLQSDSTIKTELARASAELAAIMADIKKRPFQYISF